MAKVSAQPRVFPEKTPDPSTVSAEAPCTACDMAPYSTVPKTASSAKRPMRKPKSPMRFVTKAFRPQ